MCFNQFYWFPYKEKLKLALNAAFKSVLEIVHGLLGRNLRLSDIRDE